MGPNLASRFQQTGDPEEVQDEITKKYLELSAEELQRFPAPEEGKPVKRKLNEADAFAAQFSVWSWVDLQNRSAGVAPSVAVVTEQRNLRFNETHSHSRWILRLSHDQNRDVDLAAIPAPSKRAVNPAPSSAREVACSSRPELTVPPGSVCLCVRGLLAGLLGV